MQLIRGQLRLSRTLPRCVATLGNFDGMHLGHQQLLTVLREQAQALQCPSVVITFEPQPMEYFQPERAAPRLMRFREKWRVLAQHGIDYLLCLRFDRALASCSAADFVGDILLRQLGVQAIVVGDDFRFGAKRSGDVHLLRQLAKQYGFKVVQMQAFMLAGQRVSSTRVRHALQANDFALAKRLLGRPYFLCGKVVHGDGRGHQWGFPTANIPLTDQRVSVAGIYVVQVVGLAQQPLPGVASIGVRPMFSNRGTWLEVHLLDFNRDIYGCVIEVEFLHKLRDEQRFAGTAELIAQIHQDVLDTRERLKNYDYSK